ncbi:amino acid ABC transporter permease [Orenia marismortui]|uniref:Amino acid ABC transporter membrane protein (PAAT family) n=1 Tax=Orenia marismortui TaxID=46469 RepID=A0A4R8GKY8_9FIRM|nr:amino acid ABC transporter permease [Orenia marismortui]TDX46352.1 amino acid ABC transporter membrane protein (PAAT family) [Orenia marismortui]
MINFKMILEKLPLLLPFGLITLKIALIAMLIGLLLGLVTALFRLYKLAVLDKVSELYVFVIRGTPLLVQIYIVYFGLPRIGIEFSAYNSAYLALGVNVGAYLSEVFRGAIKSIDKGQLEAALSVGMTYWQAMYRIILPQAALVALPATGNTFINLIKNTSLVFVISIEEIMAKTKKLAALHGSYLEMYITAAIVYLILFLLIYKLQAFLERNLEKAYQ